MLNFVRNNPQLIVAMVVFATMGWFAFCLCQAAGAF